MAAEKIKQAGPEGSFVTNAFTYGGVKAVSVFVGYPPAAVRSRYFKSHGTSTTISSIALEILKKEGMSGFYKRGFPVSLFHMAVKESYRGVGYEYFGHGANAALINAFADSLLLPIELIKLGQQTATNQKSASSIIQSINANGAGAGLKTYYSGFSFFFASQFFTHLLRVYSQRGADAAISKIFYDGEKTPFRAGFAGSLVAGLCVAAATNPFNQAFAKFQSAVAEGKATPSPLNILKDIAKQDGVKGLSKGSSIGFLFAVLGQVTYYTSKTLCAYMAENKSERVCEGAKNEQSFANRLLSENSINNDAKQSKSLR